MTDRLFWKEDETLLDQAEQHPLRTAWRTAIEYATKHDDFTEIRRMLRGPTPIPRDVRDWIIDNLPAGRKTSVPQHQLDHLQAAYRQQPIGQKKRLIARAADAFGVSFDHAKKLLDRSGRRKRG